jgi:hypothetical protein
MKYNVFHGICYTLYVYDMHEMYAYIPASGVIVMEVGLVLLRHAYYDILYMTCIMYMPSGVRLSWKCVLVDMYQNV